MHQMRVRIDKTRQYHPSTEVNLLCSSCLRQRLNVLSGTYTGEQTMPHQQRAILHDAQFR
jgi:hypothetical protein